MQCNLYVMLLLKLITPEWSSSFHITFKAFLPSQRKLTLEPYKEILGPSSMVYFGAVPGSTGACWLHTHPHTDYTHKKAGGALIKLQFTESVQEAPLSGWWGAKAKAENTYTYRDSSLKNSALCFLFFGYYLFVNVKGHYVIISQMKTERIWRDVSNKFA